MAKPAAEKAKAASGPFQAMRSPPMMGPRAEIWKVALFQGTALATASSSRRVG